MRNCFTAAAGRGFRGVSSRDGRGAQSGRVATDDAGGKLSSTRMADRPRNGSRGRFAAARARPRSVARGAGISRTGAGRRDAARDPRPGARRHRYRDRRRNAPRELFQPLCHRARRASTSTIPATRSTAAGPNPAGAAHGRARSAANTRWRRATCGSCAPIPSARSRSPCPVLSPWRSRPRTTTTRMRMKLAMDYAAAVNEEIKDLFAAGADIVQIDEPYMQARPDKARAIGITALNRALEGVGGTTAVHLCFGYAAFVTQRPSGYSFLPELERLPAQQISIETAQSQLDCAVLEELPGKTDHAGRDRSRRYEHRDSRNGGRAHPPRAAPCRRRASVVAPDCGMKYLPREVAFGKLKAMVEGAKIVPAGTGRLGFPARRDERFQRPNLGHHSRIQSPARGAAGDCQCAGADPPARRDPDRRRRVDRWYGRSGRGVARTAHTDLAPRAQSRCRRSAQYRDRGRSGRLDRLSGQR